MITLVGDLAETFNAVTILSGLTAGFLFGLFAFLPLVRILIPPTPPPPPPSPRTAFIAAFFVLFVLLGAVLLVFYVEQIAAEAVQHNGAVSVRAIGRFLTFLFFLFAMCVGVGLTVWREARAAIKATQDVAVRSADLRDRSDASDNSVPHTEGESK
jgi:O-antigen ligase